MNKKMKRFGLDQLIEWKKSENRKPLIIRGARQVGKTWLIKEFGNTFYDQMVYINFEKNKRIRRVFSEGFEIERIIVSLQAESGIKINQENTLIVFDEIQTVPEAITSLKYFHEDAPGYHIIAAGSLLGIMLNVHASFPVGKVEFMDLYPLSFPEFLEGVGDSGFAEMLKQGDWELITVFKQKYIERLRQYYFVGGMPEAVSEFSKSGDFTAVKKIHEAILEAYQQDFSRHAPVEIVPRIRMLWNSLPAQLAKENRKFIYGIIKEGARAKEYEIALSWLIDCGLLTKVVRVAKPAIPLRAYEDTGAFKLFPVDIGLLGSLCDLEAITLLEGNKVFSEFKGALTELFVLQQLTTLGKKMYYWSGERSTAEIDFIFQHENRIIPVEVKAEENIQAKSIKVFHKKFDPKVSVRLSMSDYRQQDWLINVPLYAVNHLLDILSKQST